MESQHKRTEISRLQKILEAEAKAVKEIPLTPAYGDAIDLIVERVHRRGGKMIVSGMGKAGQIALNIATTLSSTGTPSVFLHPSEAQHGDLGLLQPNDVLLILSNSGQTREINELIELARALFKDIPIIAITGDEESILSEKADIILFTGGAPEVCPMHLTPTTSTTVMSVMGDLLVVALMEAIGFTVEEYAKRHHGGYLGLKSKTASMNPAGK